MGQEQAYPWDTDDAILTSDDDLRVLASNPVRAVAATAHAATG